jgi:hypothetical protein
VREIKARAKRWVPMEVHENPLSKLSAEEVQGLLGANDGSTNDWVGAYKPIVVVDTPAEFNSVD